MSLLERQIAFRAALAAGDDDGPLASAGMTIYREAYRGRLLAALEASFERTHRWVGPQAFTAAACHYVLTCPPTGWTLDDYGADFPAMLANLFAQDPEVAELAWLEWQLQRAFAAIDAPTLDPAALAGVGHSAMDWAAMRFELAAGFAALPVATNCTALWAALGEADGPDVVVSHGPAAALLVWRAGLSPHYRLAAMEELRALEQLAGGATLAALAETDAAASLGPWLAQWLAEGIFSQAVPGAPEARHSSTAAG